MLWRSALSFIFWLLALPCDSGVQALKLLQRHASAVSGQQSPLAEDVPVALVASAAGYAAPAPAIGSPSPGFMPVLAAAPAPALVAAPVPLAPAPQPPVLVAPPKPPPGVSPPPLPVAAPPPPAPPPAPAMVPSTMVAAASNVDQALAAAFSTMQNTAQLVVTQQVALLNQSASNAVQAGSMAVQSEMNAKLTQQLSALTPNRNVFDQEKQAILEEKKKVMVAETEEARKAAEEIAKETVDNATGTHVLHSDDVVERLRSTQAEARELADEAIRAERLGDAASRSALAWLKKLPVQEALNISAMEKTAVNLAVSLQNQAQEAGRIDKYVDKLVSESKASAAAAEQVAEASTVASMQALEQATINARGVKEVEDLADQVGGAAQSDMATAAEASQVASDKTAAQAAKTAAQNAEAAMAKQGLTPR
eukprot:TRINITY_DN121115_c0_g1_i1.p1 TRINITY_DN121115_c0_g1~~TRINITY_DN121115_c0_g1_i1.p1  ORF type:complete len:424 (+),score=142.93 TRINITY_DN121115_c0_g1_i1:137-1408(+)